jgi:hypothetical protein
MVMPTGGEAEVDAGLVKMPAANGWEELSTTGFIRRLRLVALTGLDEVGRSLK